MKGVVFTEFFALVESAHSPVFLQETINDADLPSKGVYASTGTYPSCEMGKLVTALSEKTGLPTTELLQSFGHHLFTYFANTYPAFFEGVSCPFDFLASVENHIHVEVKKLYPDAELPEFEILEHTPNTFKMIYKSSRHLGDLCEGLIHACLSYFEETADVERQEIASDPVTLIEFTLHKSAVHKISI